MPVCRWLRGVSLGLLINEKPVIQQIVRRNMILLLKNPRNLVLRDPEKHTWKKLAKVQNNSNC